jgi:hypothetical protein
LEDLRERDHLEDLGEDVRIILKSILKKWNGDRTYLSQDRDRLLYIRQSAFGFHKIQEIS